MTTVEHRAAPARVLVTGGAGFIGSHLVKALIDRGDEVTVYDNLSVGLRQNVPAAARFIQGDVCDVGSLGAALQGHDHVVHLAARVAIRSSFDHAVEDTQTNVVGAAAVMQASRRVGTVRRVVAASSMAIYADSPGPLPINEQHATRPVSPYGISKLAMEQLVHGMAADAAMSSLVLRFFNTYGTGQALSPYVGVVTIFANALLDNQAPTIYGDGEQCRDFVHVQDVVQAILLGLRAHHVSARSFNVGTGVATSVNRLYALVRTVLGRDLPARHQPAVPGELRYSIADVSALRQHLGYEVRHRLEDALPEVLRQIAAAHGGRTGSPPR